jgi:hypothetical protein
MKFQRILIVENEPGKPEKIPGMTGKVHIRKIPLGDAKSLVNLDGMEGYSKILELSLCDASGHLLEPDEINQIPFDASQALATIATDWNGLSGKSQKELEKNSVTSQTED